MNDIFNEINEDLRRDKMMAFWNAYRNWIIAGVIAVLAGTGVSVAWKDYQTRQAASEGEIYQAALARLKEDNKAGEEALANIAGGNGHYKKLAQFQLAAESLRRNDKEQALKILSGVIEDKTDKASFQLASLQAAYLAIDLKKHDQAENFLTPLLAEGSVYQPLAMEASMINALQKGDREKAKEMMNALKSLASSAEAPSGLKERIQLLQADLGS